MATMLEYAISPLLKNLKEENRLRSLPHPANTDEVQIDLLSNDYLALADSCHSSSASRLLCRNSKEMFELENYLSSLYQRNALLFNSGYHANIGTISALAKIPNTLFLCDKQIHASIIDGLTLGLSPARFKRFAHNDVASLQKLLQRESLNNENIIIVTEGIFSMSGRKAPLKEIVDLKNEYPNVAIYLDEAHSFGTCGYQGLGLAEETNLMNEVDIRILTFGKAAASSGAAVICSEIVKSWLVNTARSLIFSTALPPAQCTYTRQMIEKIIVSKQKREALQRISSLLKSAIEKITGSEIKSESHILPIVTGDAESAILLAQHLRLHGIEALPIRRPTVEAGNEGVRLSLNADLTPEQINHIINVLSLYYNEI